MTMKDSVNQIKNITNQMMTMKDSVNQIKNITNQMIKNRNNEQIKI